MRVFIYEFVSGGGTFHIKGGHGPSGTLLSEGLAMLRAVSTDFARYRDVEVICLWDQRLPNPRWHGVEFEAVGSAAEESRLFRTLSTRCDATLVIAPEFDGLLASRVRWVEQVGGTLLSPDSRFVELTSDKILTNRHLRQSGVPVPETCAYEPDAMHWAHGVPLIVKPNDGAGSTMVRLLHDLSDVEPFAREVGGRVCLQQFCPGRAASVAVIGGPKGHITLPPFFQHVEPPNFAYAGGSRITDPALVERALALAEAVHRSLHESRGFWGVDLVLGPGESGADDRVIEVNPRLTTSYVGLRRITPDNLAAAMTELALGGCPVLSFGSDPIEFLAAGETIEPDLHREGPGP